MAKKNHRVVLQGVKTLNRGDAVVYNLKFIDEETEVGVSVTGALTLDGYEIAEDEDAVEATDTINEAIGKLEARIAVLEA